MSTVIGPAWTYRPDEVKPGDNLFLATWSGWGPARVRSVIVLRKTASGQAITETGERIGPRGDRLPKSSRSGERVIGPDEARQLVAEQRRIDTGRSCIAKLEGAAKAVRKGDFVEARQLIADAQALIADPEDAA